MFDKPIQKTTDAQRLQLVTHTEERSIPRSLNSQSNLLSLSNRHSISTIFSTSHDEKRALPGLRRSRAFHIRRGGRATAVYCRPIDHLNCSSLLCSTLRYAPVRDRQTPSPRLHEASGPETAGGPPAHDYLGYGLRTQPRIGFAGRISNLSFLPLSVDFVGKMTYHGSGLGAFGKFSHIFVL